MDTAGHRIAVAWRLEKLTRSTSSHCGKHAEEIACLQSTKQSNAVYFCTTDGEVGNWYLKKVELVIGQYLFINSIKFIGLFNLLDYVQHTIVRGTPPVSNYRHTKQTTVLKIYTIIQ